ncbi:MAG TPA: Lrp/AsnC family transcriptional regulator [Hadesarchaea archaeon]|nr:Lrp/AsnC family transcriptional regulator [Hadesarchaea archaeon]
MKLLKMLNGNAHISLNKMGREVGLSTSGIRRRIKQLEKHGLITKYSALVDPKKYGYSVVAFVNVDVDSRTMHELTRSLVRHHEVCELHRTTGAHTLMIKVRAKDIDSLNKFVDEHVQSFDSVKSVQTTLVMNTLKETLLNL